ncbi:YndJ family transporter [Dactylosporangium salmoneum]|uniref:YndJ-like protein n=1 Tax=Dactylosporangium salmoneum TaxID=53361 RepID=A0ABN3H501_9ACTN
MVLTAWAHALVNVLVALGMLVVVPLGRRLADGGHHRWWYLGAVPGAICLWLPRGALATALAATYLLAAVALLAGIPARLLPVRRITAAGLALCTALASPAVAAAALVAERSGYRLFGFKLDVLALTAAHFHYAGFAAALVAGLVARLDGRGRAAALAVPAGTGLVLAGFFTGAPVELAGAVVLTGGLWLVALHTARLAADRLTRALFLTSAAVLAATMALALDWALGRTTGLAHLTLSWMVATHGAANALGFALCSLLALRRLTAGDTVPA